MKLELPTVVVRGGGDLATGVAWRLFQCGFPLLVLELAHPLVIRRGVAFASAVFEREWTVEAVRAVKTEVPRRIERLDYVPVVVDASGEAIHALHPHVVVDGRMRKKPEGTRLDDAAIVVALGPGFVAQQHCHYVIETQRGHFLGRVYDRGSALPDSGVPGALGGQTAGRVLRAPAEGSFETDVELGTCVLAGQRVGRVGAHEVLATIAGTLRGLVHAGTPVHAGTKIGDIDPRPADEIDLCVISDKSRAVGGGALEAILRGMQRHV